MAVACFIHDVTCCSSMSSTGLVRQAAYKGFDLEKDLAG